MTRTLLDGDPPIEINLRRSVRARRLSLRVSALDGRVTLTMPARARADEAMHFVEERADWIRTAQAQVPDAVLVADGAVMPVEGVPVTVRLTGERRVRLQGAELHAPARNTGVAVRTWLTGLARDRLTYASDRYAAAVERRYSALVLRDTRSRWGSCSAAGRLMFSWRLSMAPPDVLDYVAAHEVAHLVHMDHSRAFWSTVEALCPDWAAHRDWLRVEGPGLHSVRFRV